VLTQKPIPVPKAGEVLIKVLACGICHSDASPKYGMLGNTFPRVPGHEVVGVVEKIGDGVEFPRAGQRVGIGWHGGHCSVCVFCRKGDFTMCTSAKVSGVHHDGGYAEYMLAPAGACSSVPEDMTPEEAAPLMCAGLTVFNAMRHADLHAGDVVAVQGVGGLGHLALQYSHKMGFVTVALSSGTEKAELAKKLGADYYFDTTKQNVAEELLKLGGARAIIATAPNSKAITQILPGLSVDGNLIVVAATLDPIQVTPVQLLSRRIKLSGWLTGTPRDAEETILFSSRANIKPMIEIYPLEKAEEAFTRMMANSARFRIVLKP